MTCNNEIDLIHPVNKRISIAIICGGASRRMGCNKAELPFAGTTLIEHIIAKCERLTDDLFLVRNRGSTVSSARGKTVIHDQFPHAGPLVSIASALKHSRYDRVLALACDTPLVCADTMKLLSLTMDAADIAAVKTGNTIEPLCAIYSKTCLARLEVSIQCRQLSPKCFLETYRGKIQLIDAKHILGLPETFNVNTPADYDLLLRSAENSRSAEAESPFDT